MSGYILGITDPKVVIDSGAGKWCQTGRFSNKTRLYKIGIDKVLNGNVLLSFFYPNAYENLKHYFENTGSDLNLDMTDIMIKSKQLRKFYEKELEEAKAFCSTLSPSSEPYNIVSSVIGHGDFGDERNANLFYAIGGYQFWGKGCVKVDEYSHEDSELKDIIENYYPTPKNKYNLTFTFVFFDRYNWNIEKQDAGVRLGRVVPISDATMGTFHRECLAKEYNAVSYTHLTLPTKRIV